MKPTVRSVTPPKTPSTMRISYVISPDEREREDEAAKDKMRVSETAPGSSAPVLKEEKEEEEEEEGDLVQYMCFSKSVSEQGDGIGEGAGEQSKGSGDGKGIDEGKGIEEGKGKEEVEGGKVVEVKGEKKKKSKDKEEEEKRKERDDTMMWALRSLD